MILVDLQSENFGASQSDPIRFRRSRRPGQRAQRLQPPVGAESWVTSCDLQVFVDEAAEPVPSEHADARPGTRRGVGCGWALVQGSVRAVGVEVLHILAQHDVEVAWSGDQDVIKAFPTQGADEPFRDRVRPGCPDRGADDADVGTGEDGVKGGGELAVPVADQEPGPVGPVAEIHQ